MPCVEDLSLPDVQKDLKFWENYENGLVDSYWIYYIPIGYAALIISIWHRFSMEKLDFDGHIFVIVKFGMAITFIGSYATVPMFFWFEGQRISLFSIHLFSLHGLITTVLLSRQKDNYTVSVGPNESLGIYRSGQLGILLMSVQFMTIWFSSHTKFYNCPANWLVYVEGCMFKASVCCHAIAYVLLKGAWRASRANTLVVSDDVQEFGKLVKRGDDWFFEKKKNN